MDYPGIGGPTVTSGSLKEGGGGRVHCTCSKREGSVPIPAEGEVF